MKHPIREVDMNEKSIRTVIWATGFSSDYSWLKVDALDETGKPCISAACHLSLASILSGCLGFRAEDHRSFGVSGMMPSTHRGPYRDPPSIRSVRVPATMTKSEKRRWDGVARLALKQRSSVNCPENQAQGLRSRL